MLSMLGYWAILLGTLEVQVNAFCVTPSAMNLLVRVETRSPLFPYGSNHSPRALHTMVLGPKSLQIWVLLALGFISLDCSLGEDRDTDRSCRPLCPALVWKFPRIGGTLIWTQNDRIPHLRIPKWGPQIFGKPPCMVLLFGSSYEPAAGPHISSGQCHWLSKRTWIPKQTLVAAMI